MSTRILVPLDGSGLAEQALPCAVMLARGLPAEVELLRAVQIPPDVEAALKDAAVETETPLDQMERRAQEYLGSKVERLQKMGLRAQAVVRRGPAAETIVEHATQSAVQFIVMATHGYSGISRWRHGSVAERVLHTASIPVLMMRVGGKAAQERALEMHCQRILVPLDGSPLAEQVLPPARRVAEALGARVILFRVPIVALTGAMLGDWYMPLEGVLTSAEEEAQTYLDRIAADLRARGIAADTAMQMGGVAEAIIDYAEATDVDLIAMCTHGRTGLARWTLGSVADRVLRGAHVPLLLVRAGSN